MLIYADFSWMMCQLEGTREKAIRHSQQDICGCTDQYGMPLHGPLRTENTKPTTVINPS